MTHEEIEKEAYNNYLYRQRMNIQGTDKDDWINAINNLLRKQELRIWK